MGKSSTILMCPKCELFQPCRSVVMGHINECEIEVRRRRRECTVCGHRFFTAELPYKALDELLNDRMMLKALRAQERRFIITQTDDRGETILSSDALLADVRPIIVADAMASAILPEHDDETRQAVIDMLAALEGFDTPHDTVEGEILGRQYRVQELLDDSTVI